jgi:hypothetical protein
MKVYTVVISTITSVGFDIASEIKFSSLPSFDEAMNILKDNIPKGMELMSYNSRNDSYEVRYKNYKSSLMGIIRPFEV